MALSEYLYDKFSPFFFFFLHLGCFIRSGGKPMGKSRTKSSSFSIIKRIFSSCSSSSDVAANPRRIMEDHPINGSETSSISNKCVVSPTQQESFVSQDKDLTTISSFMLSPLTNDVFPCTLCGDVFQSARSLVRHRTTSHAVSALEDSDPGKNVVHIIFQAGWMSKTRFPVIHRILKIHSNQKMLARFEEHREFVICKAARSDSDSTSTRRDERCIADGNELLRFVCSNFVCNLGTNGSSSLCEYQYCSVCNIIKCGFSHKMDGISVFSTAIAAHEAVPEDVEEEFRFMNLKRVVLVCRVVAGRVGHGVDSVAEKGGVGFDSVLRGRKESGDGGSESGGRGSVHARLEAEELIVFNPKAVLPCFVIVYTA